MTKLTKEEVQSLLNNQVTDDTVKETILEKIDAKFEEICSKIIKNVQDRNMWFDYSTEEGEQFPGYFDPMLYHDYVSFTGSNLETLEHFNDWRFPTSWLWEDDVSKLVDDEVEYRRVEKEAKRNRSRALLTAYDRLCTSARAKLTAEETMVFSAIPFWSWADQLEPFEVVKYTSTSPS